MAVKTVKDEYQFTNVWNQYFAAIAANLVALSHGCALGWVSPALPVLSSNNTPLLTGPLTSDEISWIGSVSSIGGLIGALIFGYLTALWGSKKGVLLLAAPVISFWVLIYFRNTYNHVFIARFIAGMTNGGLQSSVILFTVEIANDDIRGRLGSFTLFFRNVGILLGYIFGASLDYTYIPCISGAVPIAFVVIFLMLPNTPRYFLMKGQIEKAEKSLKFYKGYKGNSQVEQNAFYKEFEKLKEIVNEGEKGREEFDPKEFFNRKALKGIGIGIALSALSQTTACITIINYGVLTFTKLGTSMNPYISSITLAVSLIVGSMATAYLVEFGRKKLSLFSLMGTAFGLQTTALYYYLGTNGYDLSAFAWIPIFSLSLVIFLSSAGIIPCAIICSVEYLPTKVRTYGIAIICCSLNLVTFISTKMYPIFLDLVDLHGCLTIYGVCCVVGFVFVFFVLKETNGKSLDAPNNDEKINKNYNYQKRLSILSI